MTMPISESIPEEPQPEDHLTAARRRRQRRMATGESGERGEYLADLVHQGTATLDFFLFALLAGIVLGAAIITNAPALYLLAALLSPFMAPVVGMALATAAGSLRLFVRSLVSLVIGGLLVWVMGCLAGLILPASTLVPPDQTFLHTRFGWADAAVLVVGTLITIIMVAHNPRSKPLVASVALAYELFIPLGVAGFGQALQWNGSVVPGLWPDGLVVFAAYTAVAAVVGGLAFIILGIHAARAVSFLVTVLLLAVMLGAAFVLIFQAGGGGPIFPISQAATATTEPGPPLVPTATTTWTPFPTDTSTPEPPTSTPGSTNTVAPTSTPTQTPLPSATPVWGLVNAGEGNGVIIRVEPNSLETVTSLLNGNLIQILPEKVNKAGVIWIHVRTTAGLEGWVQAALIATATPRP